MSQKSRILWGALVGALAGSVVALGSRAPSFGNRGWAVVFDRLRIPALELDEALNGYWYLYFVSIAAWSLFGVYWEYAAKDKAASKYAESTSSRGLHVGLLSVAQFLIFVPIRGLGRYVPVSVAVMMAGVAVQAVGTGLAVWARRHLGRNWSGRIAINDAHELIRSGPYERLRHPIYTGLLAMYLGPALVTGEWLALIGVLLAGLAYRRKIRLEEAALDVAFGPDYGAYRRQTWALVPGLW